MMNIIKKDELYVESYLAKLQQRFQDIMDRDSQIPHAKFLFVVQRLNERYMTILRDVEKRQTKRSLHVPPPAKMLKSDGPPPSQAGGLHLLSEVAMGGTPGAQNGAAHQQTPHGMPTPQSQGSQAQTPQAQGWYPPNDMSTLPQGVAIDPMAYGQYNGQFAGFGKLSSGRVLELNSRPARRFEANANASMTDNFDFSLGGMGMNGDMYTSMDLGDTLWDFSDPALTGQYQGWM